MSIFLKQSLKDAKASNFSGTDDWENRLLKYINFRLLMIALVICIAIILAVSGAYFVNFHGGFSTSQDIWGQFGDYMGGVLNPILSFFTVVGLLLTIYLQRRQLVDAKQQYTESVLRAEQAEKEIRRQRFENTFFELIKTHTAIIDGTHINQFHSSSPSVVKGRECYKILYDNYFEGHYFDVCRLHFAENPSRFLLNLSPQFESKLYACLINNQAIGQFGLSPSQFNEKVNQSTFGQAVLDLLDDKTTPSFIAMLHSTISFDTASEVFAKSNATERLSLISQAYSVFYKEKGFLFGHYFRSLFHALSYISDGITDDDFYIDMFRAQLSSFELVMLFYNCTSSFTNAAFNKLVIHFELLKDLEKQEFIHSADFESLLITKNHELGIC